jgi:multiple sugar transport system permease protein
MLQTQQSLQVRSKRGLESIWHNRNYYVQKSIPYLLLLPAALLLIVFLIYPLLMTIYVSFWEWSLTDVNRTFIGLDNYTKLARSEVFWTSLGFTLKFTLATIVLAFAIGLGSAVVLDQVKVGREIFTSILILPYMVAPIATGLVWRLLWSHDFGLVNYSIGLFGAGPIPWLARSDTAFWAVVVSDVWRTTPFITLILLAGLTSIPHELIECARIDGGSAWQVFRRITLPLLAPAITVALVFQTIFQLRLFDIVFTLTGGGPGRDTMPLGLFIQRTYFRYFDSGEASAISVVLLVLGAVVSLIYLKLVYREVEY